MHRKSILSCSIVILSLLTGGVTSAQNEFNFNDLHPQDLDIQRSDSSQKPKQLPPIQPAGLTTPQAQPSIFDNDLRGAETSSPKTDQNQSRDFSNPPNPPAPRRDNNARGIADQLQSQDPIQALNPSRLPVIEQPNASQPNRPQFGSPYGSNVSASSIPAAASTTPKSILTPTTEANEDSRIIVPAGFENETRLNNSTTTRGPIGKKDLKSLIAEYSIANTQLPIPGVPKSLEEMLKTTDANVRLRMVQQYWETYFDWATLQNRQRYESWLNQIRTARSQTDQLLLQTAISMAKNETLAAEIQLARSQSKLQEISGTDSSEMLPLPSNDPVTSKYITHYDWYATRKMVPPKLKGINEMLPRTYQLLSQRAETVGQAEQTRNMAVSAYSSGQTGMAAVLEAGRSWQSSLQSMVATVVSYNNAISDYALTITPQQKPLADIASMLVSKPKPISASNLSGEPANAKVGGNPYTQSQTRSANGATALGPSAGPYKRPAATQQPSLAPSRNQFNNNPRTSSQNGASIRDGNGFSAQPNRATGSQSNAANNTSGVSAQLGDQKPTGTPNVRSTITPQQKPAGNSQPFQGGSGGSFGG